MELTPLQAEAVEKLCSAYNSQNRERVFFKAPTGSGKTLMASALIANLIARWTDEKFVFVIATVSSAALPLSFEQKISRYKKDLIYSKFDVEYVESPSSAKSDKSESLRKILPERNKVFIFGKASFGKGRIFTEHGIIEDFVKSACDEGYKIVYIRDEAHIGANERVARNDEGTQKFEDLMSAHAHFIVKMTATPERGAKCVELRERDLNDGARNGGKYLLKSRAETILDHSLADTEVLASACKKFKEVQKKYEALAIGVRPAMLIQVDNSSETDAVKRATFEKALEEAKATITHAGLSWACYFGDGEKTSDRNYGGAFTLEQLTSNTNEIDVIFFKIGPATGWDIPRACMLVQLRSVSSKNLAVQTLGRIKRNPYPGLEKNEVTDVYYVLSNEEETERTAREVQRYNYCVRERFKQETFLSIEIENKNALKRGNKNTKAFQSAFKEYLKKEGSHVHQAMSGMFVDGEYRKVLMVTSNGKEIHSSVRNPFIFMRDYRRLLARNRALVEKMGDVVSRWAKSEGVQEEFAMTALLEKKLKELQELAREAQPKKPVYKIRESVYTPGEYHEVLDATKHVERVPKGNYLFGINEDDRDMKNKQPLDSSPEESVFQELYDFAEDNGDVIVWAKNQTTSNISGDYLDENLEIRRSFFDFIIKFKNGHFLYLEVKSKDDIDPEKTKILMSAYDTYFKKRDLFSPRLAIGLCKVDSHREIEMEVYYDKEAYMKYNWDKKKLKELMASIAAITEGIL